MVIFRFSIFTRVIDYFIFFLEFRFMIEAVVFRFRMFRIFFGVGGRVVLGVRLVG